MDEWTNCIYGAYLSEDGRYPFLAPLSLDSASTRSIATVIIARFSLRLSLPRILNLALLCISTKGRRNTGKGELVAICILEDRMLHRLLAIIVSTIHRHD